MCALLDLYAEPCCWRDRSTVRLSCPLWMDADELARLARAQLGITMPSHPPAPPLGSGTAAATPHARGTMLPPKRSPLPKAAHSGPPPPDVDDDVVILSEAEASQARKRRRLTGGSGGGAGGASGSKLRQTQIACGLPGLAMHDCIALQAFSPH